MEYGEVFQAEAAELLEELEAALLELEAAPDDMQLVGRVFRAMHTIKGSGSMFGFDQVADFTHHVETVLDQVRDGSVPVTKALIDLTLAACDHIKHLLDTAGSGAADNGKGQEIIAAFKGVVGAGKGGGADHAPVVTSVVETEAADVGVASRLTHYRIHFQPGPDFFAQGGEVDSILEELKKVGEYTVFIHKEWEAAEGEASGDWEILLTTDKGKNAIREVFIFAESASTLTITPLAVEGSDEFPEHKLLGEILVERGELDREKLSRVLEQQKTPLGELLVREQLVCPTKVQAALAEQKLVNRRVKEKTAESIRVPADKLDRLINLVGELVVTQARLTQVANNFPGASELVEPVEGVERLTAELRDCALNIRMLPIGTSFARFHRLVRDLAAELGKEVQLVTEGAETDLDKNVIDQLGEPLVHLIRNSLDHGIESPDEREAAGKPRVATILLSARHSGGNVVIDVSDDGRGVNLEQVRDKAIAQGLLPADEEHGATAILNTLFLPGFSTAASVTSVSGRGVGMDVVKSTIEGLKGSVEFSRSETGQGTTVSIILPLTLAIIEGLLVRVGDTYFVLPLAMVEECVELTDADIARFHARRVLPVRGQLVPYVRLRDFFGIGGEKPAREQMVIVECNGERSGLVLDSVVGEHQTVLKSLGWVYKNATGLSGATILGNGEVALIVDVPATIRCAQREETSLTEIVQ